MNSANSFQIHVHGSNYDEVLKHIPKDLLPVEYGGADGTIQDLIDYWEDKFLEHRDFLMSFENYGTAEAKREGKPRYAENLFGVAGYFRKIDVD